MPIGEERSTSLWSQLGRSRTLEHFRALPLDILCTFSPRIRAKTLRNFEESKNRKQSDQEEVTWTCRRYFNTLGISRPLILLLDLLGGVSLSMNELSGKEAYGSRKKESNFYHLNLGLLPLVVVGIGRLIEFAFRLLIVAPSKIPHALSFILFSCREFLSFLAIQMPKSLIHNLGELVRIVIGIPLGIISSITSLLVVARRPFLKAFREESQVYSRDFERYLRKATDPDPDPDGDQITTVFRKEAILNQNRHL